MIRRREVRIRDLKRDVDGLKIKFQTLLARVCRLVDQHERMYNLLYVRSKRRRGCENRAIKKLLAWEKRMRRVDSNNRVLMRLTSILKKGRRRLLTLEPRQLAKLFYLLNLDLRKWAQDHRIAR